MITYGQRDENHVRSMNETFDTIADKNIYYEIGRRLYVYCVKYYI